MARVCVTTAETSSWTRVSLKREPAVGFVVDHPDVSEVGVQSSVRSHSVIASLPAGTSPRLSASLEA